MYAMVEGLILRKPLEGNNADEILRDIDYHRPIFKSMYDIKLVDGH